MSTTEKFTPTTEEVRDRFWINDGAWADPEDAEAFDRWLAAHDAEVFNAGLSRAAEIADQYAEEAREYRDNETDYPESWVGMQHHGMYHGAQDVAIRIRAAVPHDSGSPDESS